MTTSPRKLDLGLAREVVGMSLPLMGTMAGNLLMMLVDRICLAQYSSDTLAASGPAVFTAMTVITFLTTTTNLSRSCVAQAFGRSGEPAARAEGVLGMLIAAGLGVILLSLSPLLGMIPSLSDRPPAIRALESSFLELSTLFGAVMVLNVSMSAYFNGIGKTKVSLYVGLLGQVVAALAIYGLVFGRFGLPELGMRGSALGTLVGSASMLVCYVWQLPRGFLRDGLRHWTDAGRAALRAQVGLRLRRGFASGTAAGMDELGNTSFVWLAAVLGPIALTANNVNLTLNYLAIIPIIGLGIGCSVLCSNAIGRNDYDQIPPILKVTLFIEGAYVLIVSLAQVLAPTILLQPFGLSSDSQILSSAVDTTRVLWTYSASFVFSMTGAAVLEGFGMTRFILVTRIGLMWGLSLPLIYLATHHNAGDPAWLPRIWIIGSVFEFAIGCVYFWNIRQAIRKRLNFLQVQHAT
ncbi:multidrug transporter MatE [Verminephrobacter aporrectodeae subsp. tuberculatae]|uniref:MATE family efflux transporter n=1 Tax=Verminephrobacter aporrectodeae TaxID=1110389 RepID=UPI000237732F|nr:MATE family efflux transporter [Verminephrobacter aporrectodeae]MCW8164807.1 multidrug transporter MatE [Verminephrobacter aporrectodeae subsp. tuberculatae]MCW8169179.1 multidrug transporter MatE [Verminephrobacter aporrectodeae subsp. tuberculatae]